jgi:hypothetical protein
MNISYFVLLLNQSDRCAIFNENKKTIPFLSLYPSINGYNEENVLTELRKTGLHYHTLNNYGKQDYRNYGTLASFITRFNILRMQVRQQLPFVCFIEDDIILKPSFAHFVERHVQQYSTFGYMRLHFGN